MSGSDYRRARARRRRARKQKKREEAAKAKYVTCAVCFSDDVLAADAIACAEHHFTCRGCFQTCARVTSERFYVPDQFPMHCPAGCASRYSHAQIEAGLSGDGVEFSFDRYLAAELRAGLLQEAMAPGDVAITCPSCNLYAEIYPLDYRERAIMLLRARRLQDERQKSKQLGKTLLTRAKSGEAVGLRLQEGGDDDDRDGPNEDEEKKEASDALAPPELGRQISIERFSEERLKNIGLTSAVFCCRDPKCGVAQCLRCDAVLDTDEIKANHVCAEVDEVEELYRTVIEVLAEASTGNCPRCGYRGQKDLNCTHIDCPSCNTTWCYVCSQSPPGGMNNHNKWTAECLPEDNKCAMYLHYMYDEAANLNMQTGRYNGEAAFALTCHHVVKQRSAMKRLRAEVGDDKLWKAMLKRYFPDGMWEDRYLTALEKMAAQNKAFRLKREADRTEAERMQREAARRREEERRQAAIEAERRRERMRRDGHLRRMERENQEAVDVDVGDFSQSLFDSSEGEEEEVEQQQQEVVAEEGEEKEEETKATPDDVHVQEVAQSRGRRFKKRRRRRRRS